MEQFKKELKQFNETEMRIVDEICNVNMECSRAWQYEESRVHLLSIAKKFKKHESIVSILEQMIMKLDLDFDAYITNLERLHPECMKKSEAFPEGIFLISLAEYSELQRVEQV